MQQKPVSLSAPNAKAAQAYERIATRLTNIEKETTPKKKGMAAFFSNMISGKKI